MVNQQLRLHHVAVSASGYLASPHILSPSHPLPTLPFPSSVPLLLMRRRRFYLPVGGFCGGAATSSSTAPRLYNLLEWVMNERRRVPVERGGGNYWRGVL